ncbi:MAG: glycosyltransferase family 4 protein [Chloroflexota bacterium]
MARVAFVMEQTLGHVTHARNLWSALEDWPEIEPVWLPIEYGVQGVARFLPVYRGNWSLRASLRARRALELALRGRRADALLFHTQVTSLFSVDRMRRTPTVISLDATPLNFDEVTRHGGYDHEIAGDGFVDRQKYLMNRRAFQAAATLVPWSAWAKRSLIEEYGVTPEKITVLAPGAAASFFEVGRQRLAAVPPGNTADPVRILFVGGEWVRKGGPQLLEALGGLAPGTWQLDVVTRDAVPPMPGVRVHHGIGPNSPALLELFAQADLFVLPSLGECLAVVLMEATAAALPIITTDVGALAEAVRPGETGLIVPPKDVPALREALTTLVADPARRRSMAQGGHALACERFVATDNNRTLLNIVAEHARLGSRPGRAA